MKLNKKGFSIIMAILLTLVMSLLAYLILSYIIPFSENIRGIENSSKAFYEANSGIEESLYFISNNPVGSSTGKSFTTNAIDYDYSVNSTGNILPPALEGNSEYDNNFNKIYEGKPIQLEVGNNRVSDWSNVFIYFKVPNLDGDSSTPETLSGGNSLAIVNWQLSSSTDTLNSSGSQVKASDVNTSNQTPLIDYKLNLELGSTLIGSVVNFQNFYNNKCSTSGSSCILKMSIINTLKQQTTNKIIPYLEWKIDFSTNSVPTEFVRINSSGKSYGFRKNLKMKVSQKNTNEAFDFTIFQ